MTTLFLNSSSNTTKKTHIKVHRSRHKISRKIVAFDEISSLDRKRSKREISSLLEVPNSTMQSWIANKPSERSSSDIDFFYRVPKEGKYFSIAGLIFLIYSSKLKISFLREGSRAYSVRHFCKM